VNKGKVSIKIVDSAGKGDESSKGVAGNDDTSDDDVGDEKSRDPCKGEHDGSNVVGERNRSSARPKVGLDGVCGSS